MFRSASAYRSRASSYESRQLPPGPSCWKCIPLCILQYPPFFCPLLKQQAFRHLGWFKFPPKHPSLSLSLSLLSKETVPCVCCRESLDSQRKCYYHGRWRHVKFKEENVASWPIVSDDLIQCYQEARDEGFNVKDIMTVRLWTWKANIKWRRRMSWFVHGQTGGKHVFCSYWYLSRNHL